MSRGAALALAVALAACAGGEDPGAAERAARIDALFSAWDRDDSAGAVVGVVSGGEPIFARGYGMASLEHRAPLTPRSVFYIASVAKQFTAAAVALLVLDGTLSLEDDVRTWVPELPEYGAPITVRHLIHHTSGLRDYLTLMTFAGRSFGDSFGNDDAIALLGRQEGLNFLPGERYAYSNSGYVLLAEILERASGKSSQVLSAERIFTPLGMADTRWGTDPSLILADRVTSYGPRDGGEGLRRYTQNFSAHGDGNLWTTLEDLVRWDDNFTSGRVGGERFLELIHSPGRLADGTELHYAFGLAHDTHRGHRTVSHGGSMLGFRSELLRFPDAELSVVVLANLASLDAGRLAREVADLYLEAAAASGADDADQAYALAAAELGDEVGAYYNEEMPLVVDLALEEGRPILAGLGPELPLVALSATRLRSSLATSPLILELDTGEAPSRVTLDVPRRGPPIVLRRIEPLQPTVEELRPLAGRYYSRELDARYELRISGSSLQIATPNGMVLTPRPLVADHFLVRDTTLRFQREGDGSVGGFLLGSPRASGIRFVRIRP